MCQQVIQFCSGSTKPLLFAGGCLSLILAAAIGYTGCTSLSLYKDIDLENEKLLPYYVQIFTAGYLTLITLFTCLAAHFDQKHSIRVLAIVTTLNFVIAVAAIVMTLPSKDSLEPITNRLMEAEKLYDFTHKDPVRNETLPSTAAPGNLTNVPTPDGKTRTARMAEPETNKTSLTKERATKIWDLLQERGCCGLGNSTEEWKADIPKSCCAPLEREDVGGKYRCKKVDADHQRPCKEIIEASGVHLMAVLALIALVNLYLATVTGLSTYKHFHYSEASQNAYS